MTSNIDCIVKVLNVPDTVKNGLYGFFIVARYEDNEQKWWYYAVFNDSNKAHDCAKEVGGAVFYYQEGDNKIE